MIKIGKNAKDLTDQKFNLLIAKEPIGKTKRNQIIWKCLCECGNTVPVIGGNLISENTTSCGCVKKQRAKENCAKGRVIRLPLGRLCLNTIYGQYRTDSNRRNRNYVFELTLEQFEEIVTKNCHYCGKEPKPFIDKRLKQHSGHFSANGIDRKDNSQGYTLTNCLPCCKTCNHAKAQLGYDDFIAWINKAFSHLSNQAVA